MVRGKRYKVYSRLAAFMLVVMLITSVLGTVTAFANGDYSFSLEDVFETFATEQSAEAIASSEATEETNVIAVKGDYVLPTWAMLRKEVVGADVLLGLNGDAYTDAVEKNNIAKAILAGFKNSSTWSKYKKAVEEVCVYKKDTQELVLLDESTKTSKKYEGLLAEFDKAMLLASVSAMTDISKAGNDTKFTVIASNSISYVIGVLGVISFEMGRLAMSFMSVVTICELFYIGVEPLRPILGFETQPKFFKKLTTRGEELGNDSTRVFRLVGAAARSAVAKEYEINNNMSEVHKNNLLASYLFGKVWYLLAMFVGVAIIDSRLWGSICTGLMSFFMGLA